MNLKFLLQLGIINLICLIDNILFQTFKIILNILLKKHEALADNSSVEVYVNKIRNKIVFEIMAGYKLELLFFETMNLLGSIKKDVDQDKDG